MSVLGGGPRLPCGAPIADLLDQVAAGDGAVRSVHQRSCRFCGQALEDVLRWWTPIGVAAAQQITPPAGLISRVMARIGRLGGSTQVVVSRGERGVSGVTVWAVAAVAAQAAAAVPGVAAVSGWTARPLPAGSESDASGFVSGAAVVVDVEIAVTAGIAIPRVVAAVRRRVGRDLTALDGVDAVEVNVTVIDVADPSAIPPNDGSA